MNSARVALHWRSGVLLFLTSVVGIVGFTWPLFTDPTGSENLAHASDAPWLFVVVLPLLVAVLLAELAEGNLDSKAIAVLAVLVACGGALRAPTVGVTGFTGVFFLLIPGGRVFGRGFGFVQGALTMFVSALLTGGVGPWLPFQMFGAAWVGFLAACLPPLRGRREIVMLAIYGAVAGFVYGLVMDMWFWPFATTPGSEISYLPGAGLVENLHRFWAFHVVSALGFDIPRALGNAALVLLLGSPVLAALRRAAHRAAFGAPVIFDPSPADELELGAPAAASLVAEPARQ